MANSAEPSFIDRDAAQVTADLIAIYEQVTGKTLQPAQPERLFIDVIAYREMLLRVAIQQTGLANLVRFAPDLMLDFLGELVGCRRLPAQSVRTTLHFVLSAPLGVDYTIPAGTERGSKDNLYTFATTADLVIPAGQTTGDVAAQATAVGVGANGYLPGDINVEIDPIPNVASCANTSTTMGGADIEDPDHYRARIMLAPEGFSTAGPQGAYEFWASSAHQDICAVAVTTPAAGQVNVYPLMSTGLPDASILALVEATLTASKVRPLTDQVSALAPTEVDFTIEAAVTLYDWCTDDDATAIANISALLNSYTATMRATLGTDIVTDQIRITIGAYRGFYSVAFTTPADQVLADNEWANCTAIAVTIAGRVHG